MDAIQFVNNYQKMLSDIENICKPELLPALNELKETDPHDLVQPDTYFPLQSAQGYVLKLFLREVRNMNKTVFSNHNNI